MISSENAVTPNSNAHLQNTDTSTMYSALDIIKSRGFINIKAVISDYETPSKLTKKGTEKSYTPHITAKTDQGKHYFEIVSKTKKDPEKLVDKWTLLSSLADVRNGTFFLVVPHGKLSFTKNILKQHSIHANVLKVQ